MTALVNTPLLLTLLFIVSRSAHAEVCSNATTLETSLNLLLAEYDRQQTSSAIIELGLAVRHANLFERSATLKLIADLTMNWLDERLIWNETDWDCDTAHVAAEQIWLPDVVALNSGATSGASGDSQRAKISSTGKVTWILRLEVATPCALDLDKWPNDIQTCRMNFGSRTLTSEMLKLRLFDPKSTEKWDPGAWELESIDSSITKETRADEEYDIASWSISLARRAPAHALVSRVIIAAVVLQLVAAAILTPASRPPICASAALTATLWMVAVLLRMPTAASTPRALSLTAGALVMACIAALTAALVQRVARLRTAPPHCARRFVSASIVYSFNPEQAAESASSWASVAQLLDFVLLIIFAIIFSILICIYV